MYMKAKEKQCLQIVLLLSKVYYLLESLRKLCLLQADAKLSVHARLYLASSWQLSCVFAHESTWGLFDLCFQSWQVPTMIE